MHILTLSQDPTQVTSCRSSIRWLIAVFLCLFCSCVDDLNTSLDLDLVDVEGPQFQTSTPGPWLVRVGLPPKIQKQTKDDLASLTLRVETEDQRWDVPLFPTGRPDLRHAIIPAIEPFTLITYQVYSANQPRNEEIQINPQPLSLRSTFKYHPIDSPLPLPESSCELLLNAPNPEIDLTLENDRSQSAGLQVHFDFTLLSLYDGWVQLITPLETKVVSIIQQRAFFSKVTLPYGRQRIRVQGIGKTGRLCGLEFTLFVDAPSF